MAWEIGWRGEVEIVSNSVETVGDKDAVKLYVRSDDGDTGTVFIFMTEKSMNMARAQLKIAGFDPDKQRLSVLVKDAECLSGNRVPIVIEEYKNRASLKIDMQRTPEESALDRYDKLLRSKPSAAKAAHPAEPVNDDMPF